MCQTQKTPSQSRVETIIQMLQGRGWILDGETRAETVRVPTMRAPVSNHGKSGGELRTFGGRTRLAKDDRRVTVGARTTCFYRLKGKEPVDFDRVSTKDIESIFVRS